MTKNEVKKAYFDWMCRLVCGRTRKTYYKLFHYLYSKEFTYTLEMDGNRYDDGIELRYRFGYEQNFSQALIADSIDDCPCSILEMMVALAIRMEEHIMVNPDIGDRTGKWFWEMLDSLGLDDMDDQRYDSGFTEDTISRFLEREYDFNGKGGLFYLKKCDRDLRNMEIWYQACWYLRQQCYG